MDMHARVTQFQLLPGKLQDFAIALDSLVPLMREQAGFRSLIVLRGEATPGAPPQATVITLWDSLEALRASEENLYFYRAMARVLEFSEGFPAIHEHKVLIYEFSAAA